MTDRKYNRKLAKVKRQCEQHKQMKELLDSYDGFLPVVRAKKKKKVSNIILVVAVSAIIAYTIANFWLEKTIGTHMDSTFTTCFYAFWGSELFAIAGIKITDTIKGKSLNDDGANPDDQC